MKGKDGPTEITSHNPKVASSIVLPATTGAERRTSKRSFFFQLQNYLSERVGEYANGRGDYSLSGARGSIGMRQNAISEAQIASNFVQSPERDIRPSSAH